MEDSGIIRLYWERDERAIPATAGKYGHYCTGIARNIVGSREDAEECVSDTWLRAWNAMPPHRPAVLSAFLGKIVRNIAFNRYRYNTAGRRGGGELPAVLDELEELVSGAEDVDRALDDRALTAAVDEFLDGLPERKRNIFVRRYWYTESVTAIAARYGMSTGAVSMTLARLREKLREHLRKGGFAL